MGLFGGSKMCPLCGNKMPLFGNAKMADATLCATCKGREFSGDMQLYEFYRPMPFSALDGYRAYRAQNVEKLKDFEETDLFFGMIHLDRDTGQFFFYQTPLDKNAAIQLNPDVYDLKDLLFYDYLYVNATYKEGMLGDKIIADIQLIIATKHPYHPYSLAGTVKTKVKLKVQTGFFGGVKGFDNDPELMEFGSYILEHMPQEMSEMMLSFTDPDLTDIPPELQGQYDIHFGKLQELRNIGVIDREAYKNYPDNNIANKKLRHVLRKKYGLR